MRYIARVGWAWNKGLMVGKGWTSQSDPAGLSWTSSCFIITAVTEKNTRHFSHSLGDISSQGHHKTVLASWSEALQQRGSMVPYVSHFETLQQRGSMVPHVSHFEALQQRGSLILPFFHFEIVCESALLPGSPLSSYSTTGSVISA